jgi:polyisoprenoid-binding protein YceI
LFVAALTAAAAVATPLPVTHPRAEPVTWVIDRGHSSITFTIRHLISKVSGTFGDWSGTIITDPKKLSGGSVEVVIKTASVNTNNEKRDHDLRTDSTLFAVEKFPEMRFRSTKVEQKGDDVKVYGDLTIRDVTKPVVLTGKLLGVLPAGQRRATIAFEASTTINRLDYGVKWNRVVESGNLLGDDVTINIQIEAVQAAPPKPPQESRDNRTKKSPQSCGLSRLRAPAGNLHIHHAAHHHRVVHHHHLLEHHAERRLLARRRTVLQRARNLIALVHRPAEVRLCAVIIREVERHHVPAHPARYLDHAGPARLDLVHAVPRDRRARIQPQRQRAARYARGLHPVARKG